MTPRPEIHVLVVDDSRSDFEIITRELDRVRAFRAAAKHCPDGPAA